MPRPMRSQARPVTRVRFRHRSWMRAMTLATIGWSIVWGSLASARFGAPPAAEWVYVLAAGPAVLGTAYALLTVRARRIWLFMALIAVFANLSLLGLPFLFDAQFRAALGH